MAAQESQSEIELVIHTTPKNMTSTNNHNHKKISLHTIIIIAKRSPIIKSILTKFHAGYFRISISLGGQALSWKTLMGSHDRTSPLRRVLHSLNHPIFFLVLWSFALLTLILLSLLYFLKCLFFFKRGKAEFLHHVGVNYLFAPWISWLLLLQSSPVLAPKTVPYLVLWWVFIVPMVVLDVKIYGQWFTKGKRFFSTVANPMSHISVIGNLLGTQVAACMGWRETVLFLFSLGMVHYLVLFVTLYQRLSGGNHLPVMLRPVFFLFFASPSAVSLAWESIVGAFDMGSKILFFLSLFLLTSLASTFQEINEEVQCCMVVLLIPDDIPGFGFDRYAQEAKGVIAHVLMLLLL